jgi:hypothetical protein
LVRPKGITTYSKWPYSVWNTIFHSSPSQIHKIIFTPQINLGKHLGMT